MRKVGLLIYKYVFIIAYHPSNFKWFRLSKFTFNKIKIPSYDSIITMYEVIGKYFGFILASTFSLWFIIPMILSRIIHGKTIYGDYRSINRMSIHRYQTKNRNSWSSSHVFITLYDHDKEYDVTWYIALQFGLCPPVITNSKLKLSYFIGQPWKAALPI